MVTAEIPKTDIHMHSDMLPRLDQLIARRAGRPQYDWEDWLRRVVELPPGMPRLKWLNGDLPYSKEDFHEDSHVVAWLTEAVEKAAQDGAVLVEIRG